VFLREFINLYCAQYKLMANIVKSWAKRKGAKEKGRYELEPSALELGA